MKKKIKSDGAVAIVIYKFAIVLTYVFNFGPLMVLSNPHINDFGFVIVIFHLFGRINSVLCLNRVCAKKIRYFLINPRYSKENRLLCRPEES